MMWVFFENKVPCLGSPLTVINQVRGREIPEQLNL